MYNVIDIQTKAIIGTYKDRKAAKRVADKKDAVYGAVRFVVKFVG